MFPVIQVITDVYLLTIHNFWFSQVFYILLLSYIALTGFSIADSNIMLADGQYNKSQHQKEVAIGQLNGQF